MQYNKKTGFTLAEVLTTLMLIGVIAALTIPFFYQEMQKARWTVTYKRTFAETFNALTRITMDDDCSKSLTCTHIFDGTEEASTKAFGDELTKIMSVQQNCGIKEDATGCFAHKIKPGLTSKTEDAQTLSDTMTKNSDGGSVSLSCPFYTFKTVRGVSYALWSFGTNCLNESNPANASYINWYVDSPDDDNNQMLSLCGFMIVDVNGEQKPNVWGRDVFGIWVTDRSVLGVYPFGGDFDKQFNAAHNHCNENDGRGCAAQLIRDGWVMKY